MFNFRTTLPSACYCYWLIQMIISKRVERRWMMNFFHPAVNPFATTNIFSLKSHENKRKKGIPLGNSNRGAARKRAELRKFLFSFISNLPHGTATRSTSPRPPPPPPCSFPIEWASGRPIKLRSILFLSFLLFPFLFAQKEPRATEYSPFSSFFSPISFLPSLPTLPIVAAVAEIESVNIDGLNQWASGGWKQPREEKLFSSSFPSFCWHSRHETQRKRIFHRRLFVNDPFQLRGTSALGSSSSSSSGAPSFDIQRAVSEMAAIYCKTRSSSLRAVWSWLVIYTTARSWWWWFRHSNREGKKEKGAIDQKGEFA